MEKHQLERWLRHGLSLEEIGRRLGRHPSTVSYWLRKLNLAAAHADRFAPKGRIPKQQLELLARRGLTGAAISSATGRSPSTVRYWLERYGLETERMEARRRVRAARQAGQLFVTRTCPRHGETRHRRQGGGRYRCVRCNSQAVSRRRRTVKQILVREAGGCCTICGYDRYAGALQFHHREPTLKSFALSRKGVTRSIAEAREEARKCVLLCANCHAEVEAGVTAHPGGRRLRDSEDAGIVPR